jgi:hypothetical protein
MSSFTDTAGRKWVVAFDGAALARAGITRKQLLRADFWTRLGNARQFGEMIYALCEPEILQRRLSPEAFIQAVAPVVGKVVEAIQEAHLETMEPSVRQRMRYFYGRELANG